MDRFEQLEEKTGVPAIVWQCLAESAKMEAEMVGTMAIESEILNDHHELQGVPIGVNEAGRKYGIPAPTISGWINRELVKILRRPDRRKGFKVELDEASVALAAELYHQNPGPGKNPLKPLKRKASS